MLPGGFRHAMNDGSVIHVETIFHIFIFIKNVIFDMKMLCDLLLYVT